MKQPFVVLAIVFSCGIFSAAQARMPFIAVYCLAAVFLLLSSLLFEKNLIFDLFLILLCFVSGAVLLKNSGVLPNCHISGFFFYGNEQPCIIKGFVENEPQTKFDKTSFIFRAQSIQCYGRNRGCCGNILVHIKGKGGFSYGEELIIRGNLYRPFNGSGPGKRGYRDYLYNRGVWFILNIRSDADIIRLKRNSGFFLKRFALWLKEKTEKIIRRHSSSFSSGVLEAMLLGEKKNVPWFINDSMMKSGTLHILVVSGFNVGIIAFIIHLLLKLIRLPRKPRLILAVPLLIIYCLLTGASPPVVRATVMGIVFTLAYLFQREPDICNSCALAAVFILAGNPRQLFDASFQLSFASVISIVYFYPILKSLTRLDLLEIKPARYLFEGCLVSFSAWLGTAGFIAYYFGIFSPVTVLANIFVVPLAALITLCGLSLVAASSVCPPAAPLFAAANELLVVILFGTTDFLTKLPGAYLYL